MLFGDNIAEGDRIAHLSALNEWYVTFERSGPRLFALDLEPEADVDEVRRRLDALVTGGVLEYETCEARVPGSFDDAPSDSEEAS